MDTDAIPDDAPHLDGPSLRESLRTPGAAARVAALADWWARSRPGRTLSRYGMANGGLLSSGMALTTLLSLTAALTVGWTLLMRVLGQDETMRNGMLSALDAALPGLVSTDSSSGLIDPDSLVFSSALTLTSLIGFLVMVWTAMSLVGSMASSIRAMFALTSTPRPFWVSLLRNLTGVLGVGLSVILGAGLGILVDVFGEWTSAHIGLDDTGVSLLRMLAALAGALVYALVTVLLVRVVAGVRVPRRDLAWGTVMVAAASTVLRMLGTTAVTSVSGPLLTTATTLVTLVLWINLQVRVLLTVAAWMANPPRPQPIQDPAQVHFRERPNYVTMSVPATLAWGHHPVTGSVEPAHGATGDGPGADEDAGGTGQSA